VFFADKKRTLKLLLINIMFVINAVIFLNVYWNKGEHNMKSLGIRTLDKRGNVTIPKSFLKVHDIKKGDYFELWFENDALIIQKLPVNRCIFCGKTNDLLPVNISGKSICQTCFDLLKENTEI
jgi:bifunctional DNA-binding transcriptional regulator/antitoxin component of YhaV-PrlF toxin-antitoxin module